LSVITQAPAVAPVEKRRAMGSAFYLDGATSATEARRLAGLDWEAVHAPLYVDLTVVGKPGIAPVDKERGVVRNDTGEMFGVVGKEHQILSNAEFFDFADTLMAEAGTTWAESSPFGGARANGASPFLAFRLPEGVQIAGQDAVNLHVLLSNGHVGNGSAVVTALPIRMRCSNVVAAAIRRGKQNLGTFRIQHSGDIGKKMEQARAALAITTEYAREFEAIANRLADIDFGFDAFTDFLTELVPVSDDAGKKAIATAETQRAAFRRNWLTPTLTDDLRPTAWGALNVVTEVIDHGNLDVRKSKVAAPERRLNSVHFGAGARLRDRAFTLLGAG
jgi:phage/plasmid-like protein (TIGR03299 family)